MMGETKKYKKWFKNAVIVDKVLGCLKYMNTTEKKSFFQDRLTIDIP